MTGLQQAARWAAVAGPSLAYAAAGLVVALLDPKHGRARRAVLAAGAVAAGGLAAAWGGRQVLVAGGLLGSDGLTLHLVLLVSASVLVLLGLRGQGPRHRQEELLAVSAIGLVLGLGARNILFLVLCLEVAWLPAFWGAVEGRRGGLGVLVGHMLAASALLFGAALLLEAGGGLGLDSGSGTAESALARVGYLLVLAGLAWKMSAFPFGVGWPALSEAAPAWAVLMGGLGIGTVAASAVARLAWRPAGAAMVVPGAAASVGVAAVLAGSLALLRRGERETLLPGTGVAWAGWLLLAAVTGSRGAVALVAWSWWAGLVAGLAAREGVAERSWPAVLAAGLLVGAPFTLGFWARVWVLEILREPLVSVLAVAAWMMSLSLLLPRREVEGFGEALGSQGEGRLAASGWVAVALGVGLGLVPFLAWEAVWALL